MDFYQPEGSYRFSSDALCLARFACNVILDELQKKKPLRPCLIMDIGCGCGVIGILVLQFFKELYPELYPYLNIIGIEKEEELYQAAKYNARVFAHEKNYFALQADISQKESVALVQKFVLETALLDKLPFLQKQDGGVLKNPRLFDFVLTNPPWYRAESKLHSVFALRNNALFGDENVLEMFFAFGEKFLKKNASLITVAKSACFMDFVHAMPEKIQLVAMQSVHNELQKKSCFLCFTGKVPEQGCF